MPCSMCLHAMPYVLPMQVDVSEAVAAEELIHTVQKHQHQLLETILPQEVRAACRLTHACSLPGQRRAREGDKPMQPKRTESPRTYG